MFVPLHRRVLILFRSHVGGLAALTLSVSLVVGLISLQRGGNTRLVTDFLASGVLLVSVLGALILTHSMVSDDFRTGAALLWLQKPMSPVKHYGRRWCDAVVAWTILCVAYALSVRIVIAVIGLETETEILVTIPRIWLTCLVVSAVAFGLSPWLFRGGGIVAVAVWVSGVFLHESIPVFLGGTAPAGPWYGMLVAPEHALDQVAEVMRGDSQVLLPALLWIGGYSLIWIVIGLVGVIRAERDGLARA